MIYGLASAILFGVVDVVWWKLLPGASIWRALFWRSLSSSFILIGLLLCSEGFHSIMDLEYGQVLLWPAVSGVLGLIFFSGALKVAPAELVVPIINLTGLGVWIWSWGSSQENEALGGLRWCAFAFACFGVLSWLVPAWRQGKEEGKEVLGALYAVLAVLIWSRGYAEYPLAMAHVSPFFLAASVEVSMCLIGGLVAFFAGAIMEASQRMNAMLVGVGVAAAVASLTLAYSQLPTAMVGLLSMLTPVVVLLLTRIWLKTSFRRRDVVAIGCLLVANGLQALAEL